MTNRKPTAMSRMRQDYLRLKRDPIPYITAEPLPTNLLEWHYVVRGPEDSPYQGGYYHGLLIFPREFPFKPPSIYMLTPNGRFKTNTRLCLSISDFHPDTWNPTWSVGTILAGLLSFMMENTPTFGSTESTVYEKQQYARKSLAFNLKNPNFRELFPEICEEINTRLQKQQKLLQFSNGNKLPIQSGISGSNNNNKCSDNNANNNTNSNNLKDKNTSNNNSNRNNINGNGDAFEDIDVNDFPRDGTVNPMKINSVNDGYSNRQSIYSNVIVILSFAIFALIVNYVIKNLN